MISAALALTTMLAAPAGPPPSPAETRHSTRVIRDATLVENPQLRRDFRRAQALGDAGLTLGVTGLAVGALVTLPSWFVYRADLERAEDREYRVDGKPRSTTRDGGYGSSTSLRSSREP